MLAWCAALGVPTNKALGQRLQHVATVVRVQRKERHQDLHNQRLHSWGAVVLGAGAVDSACCSLHTVCLGLAGP